MVMLLLGVLVIGLVGTIVSLVNFFKFLSRHQNKQAWKAAAGLIIFGGMLSFGVWIIYDIAHSPW